MEHISFVAFVIFSTQFWSSTTVLLVSLDFLAPVECNMPIKFLLSSTVMYLMVNVCSRRAYLCGAPCVVNS